MLVAAPSPGLLRAAAYVPASKAADLIFQHAAAPTSGPHEGDLPCLCGGAGGVGGGEGCHLAVSSDHCWTKS